MSLAVQVMQKILNLFLNVEDACKGKNFQVFILSQIIWQWHKKKTVLNFQSVEMTITYNTNKYTEI